MFAAGPFLVDNGVTELKKKIGTFVRRVNKKSLIYPTKGTYIILDDEEKTIS